MSVGGWLSAPDGDGLWWFTYDSGLVYLATVIGNEYSVTGSTHCHKLYGEVRPLSYHSHAIHAWQRAQLPSPPPKPIDLTRWHPGNPTKPGLWWVHEPGKNPQFLAITQYELNHPHYAFAPGTNCAYAGPTPALPQEQE